MLEEILKAIPVILVSCLKFILGPLEGYALKLHPVTTALSTIVGMMLSVTTFTYFGNWIKARFFKSLLSDQYKPSTGRRKFLILVKRYGLGGVAFFTPLILTPIGGTLLAVSMGKPREKILLFMLISATAWSILFTFSIYAFGRAVLPNFIK